MRGVTQPNGFAQWLAAQAATDLEVARRLRVPQQRLSRYKLGQRMPRPTELVRLMRLTGLTADAFLPVAKLTARRAR